MLYPIINFQSNDIDGFIKQWSEFYNYPKIHLYQDNINKLVLKSEDLEQLYEWKNGTPLSGKDESGNNHGRKFGSLSKNILSQESAINELKKDFDLNIFNKKFGDISFVWKIFLLHILSPNKYPIYDQHVHRAYLFLNRDKSFEEIDDSISKKAKSAFYFDIYLPFITSKIKENSEFKIQDIDKAFFSFGQFLKKYKVQLEK